MTPNNKIEFLSLCKNELNIIHEFEQNYSSNQALLWYTKKSFIYRILNINDAEKFYRRLLNEKNIMKLLNIIKKH